MFRIHQFTSSTVKRSAIIARKFSPLEFRPVLDPPMDPINETARTAFEKSCYLRINWKISSTTTVEEAIRRMVANKIGCLAVSESDEPDSDVIGVFSERDYISKVALLGKSPKDTKVLEVCTHGVANLVSVTLDNPVDACMEKMLGRDIRHLLIRQKQTGKIVGMISIKDLVKCVIAKHMSMVEKLQDVVVQSEILKQI